MGCGASVPNYENNGLVKKMLDKRRDSDSEIRLHMDQQIKALCFANVRSIFRQKQSNVGVVRVSRRRRQNPEDNRFIEQRIRIVEESSDSETDDAATNKTNSTTSTRLTVQSLNENNEPIMSGVQRSQSPNPRSFFRIALDYNKRMEAIKNFRPKKAIPQPTKLLGLEKKDSLSRSNESAAIVQHISRREFLENSTCTGTTPPTLFRRVITPSIRGSRETLMSEKSFIAVHNTLKVAWEKEICNEKIQEQKNKQRLRRSNLRWHSVDSTCTENSSLDSGDGLESVITFGTNRIEWSNELDKIDSVDRRAMSGAVAEAAAKRLAQPEPGLTAAQRRIREQARKELEEEQRRMESEQGSATLVKDERDGVYEVEHPEQISTLLYTCDLFDNSKALPKEEMIKAAEEYLREILKDEPVEASVIMIWSLNNQEKIELAVPILLKYLNNIISSPNEAKYRRIRTSNRVFTEKIAAIKGGVEFLKAVGFMEDDERNSDGSIDTFLALPEPDETSLTILETSASSLDHGAQVSLKVYRDPKIYRVDPSKPIPRPEIPADFFSMSAEEIRNEQQKRAEEVDKLTTLRTSKMREADSRLRHNYKYTLIRVRFPNYFVLQGIFSAHESFGAIREFVAENLAAVHGEFTIANSSSGNTLGDDDKSFYDHGLVPASLLHFTWDTDTLTDLSRSGQTPTYLRSDLEQNAESL